MPGRRGLPVLAELAAPGRDGARAWSLRRQDFEALAPVRERLQGRRAVAVAGPEGLAAPVALALAGAASATGSRTALLECDLRRPRVARELGLATAPGLHEYLRWETAAPQILQPLVLVGPVAPGAGEPLVSVVAGRPAAQPSPLLESESFRHAVAKLTAGYELTVLLAPPLEEEGALALVAARADSLLVCLGPSQASGRSRRALRRRLRRLPAPALGAVVLGAAAAQRS